MYLHIIFYFCRFRYISKVWFILHDDIQIDVTNTCSLGNTKYFFLGWVPLKVIVWIRLHDCKNFAWRSCTSNCWRNGTLPKVSIWRTSVSLIETRVILKTCMLWTFHWSKVLIWCFIIFYFLLSITWFPNVIQGTIFLHFSLANYFK